MKDFEQLKIKILQKKELKGIPSDFLDKYIEEYKNKNQKVFQILEEKKYNEKSKEFDLLKKYIRKKLREVHGVFSKNNLGKEKKKKLLINLVDDEKKENSLKEILSSHQSTFERIDYYIPLYKKIFEEEHKKIKKIIDLGCGYNPFSYKLMGFSEKENPEYLAVDINTEEMEFIKCFFEKEKISGKCLTLDLSKKENLEVLKKESEKSDICFMFKLLDSLESKKRGSSKELIESVNSKKIIVSFPLKTISGKSEIKGKRKWFEKIIAQNGFLVDEFVVGPEKYYVLKRKNS